MKKYERLLCFNVEGTVSVLYCIVSNKHWPRSQKPKRPHGACLRGCDSGRIWKVMGEACQSFLVSECQQCRCKLAAWQLQAWLVARTLEEQLTVCPMCCDIVSTSSCLLSPLCARRAAYYHLLFLVHTWAKTTSSASSSVVNPVEYSWRVKRRFSDQAPSQKTP